MGYVIVIVLAILFSPALQRFYLEFLKGMAHHQFREACEASNPSDKTALNYCIEGYETRRLKALAEGAVKEEWNFAATEEFRDACEAETGLPPGWSMAEVKDGKEGPQTSGSQLVNECVQDYERRRAQAQAERTAKGE